MVVRARSGRLPVFADNAEVVVAPDGLTEPETGALTVKSRCVIERKDSEYIYSFCGPVEIEAQATVSNAAAPAPKPGRGSEINGAGEANLLR